jgi:hypothetical protein
MNGISMSSWEEEHDKDSEEGEGRSTNEPAMEEIQGKQTNGRKETELHDNKRLGDCQHDGHDNKYKQTESNLLW